MPSTTIARASMETATRRLTAKRAIDIAPHLSIAPDRRHCV